MYLLVIAWAYVVLMMCVAEATAAQGTLLGALVTLIFYGVLPLGLVLYLMATPMRRRARRQAEANKAPGAGVAHITSGAPDAGRHAPAHPVAPVREKT